MIYTEPQGQGHGQEQLQDGDTGSSITATTSYRSSILALAWVASEKILASGCTYPPLLLLYGCI